MSCLPLMDKCQSHAFSDAFCHHQQMLRRWSLCNAWPERLRLPVRSRHKTINWGVVVDGWVHPSCLVSRFGWGILLHIIEYYWILLNIIVMIVVITTIIYHHYVYIKIPSAITSMITDGNLIYGSGEVHALVEIQLWEDTAKGKTWNWKHVFHWPPPALTSCEPKCFTGTSSTKPEASGIAMVCHRGLKWTRLGVTDWQFLMQLLCGQEAHQEF